QPERTAWRTGAAPCGARDLLLSRVCRGWRHDFETRSRPGGNMTGVTFGSGPLQPKRLGLLHELVPPPATIAWLRDPRGPSFEMEEKEVPAAARELGRQLLALNAQSVREIDAAFATIVQSRAGALLVGSSIFLNNRRRQLAALAVRHGIPAIANIREFVL